MFETFRDYFSEFKLTQLLENSLFSRLRTNSAPDPDISPDFDIRRQLHDSRDIDLESQHTAESLQHYKDVLQGYAKRDYFNNAAFEFFKPTNPLKAELFNESRLPAPGITSLPFRFHRTNPRLQHLNSKITNCTLS
jgi:hypothetical protein